MYVLLLFVSLVFQSQASVLIRFAEAPSLVICFWRLLMATGLLAPWAYLARENRTALKTLNAHDWFQLGLCGFFLFLHFYLFFRAVQETSIANAMVLYSINPVITAIGAYFFFRERVTLQLVLACLLGIAGVFVLFKGSLNSQSSSLQGDIWSVLSAVFFSGYILTGKHVRRKLANTAFASAIYFQTALYSAIVMWFLNTPFTGYPNTTWWVFLVLAIVPTLGGHAIFTYCLNHLNVNFMSCAKLIEPVLAAGVASWLFNEPITSLGVIGFILTSASVMVLYWEPVRNALLRRKKDSTLPQGSTVRTP